MKHIHYHPNNEAPTRFRLQIKVPGIRIQEYYSFKKYGSPENALAAAVSRRDALLKIHDMRENLGFRQIFTEDNFVRGLTFHYVRPRHRLTLCLYNRTDAGSHEFVEERTVNEYNVDIAYQSLIDRLIALKKINLDPEDFRLLKKIKMNYVREFHRLCDVRGVDRKQNINSFKRPVTLFDADTGKVEGINLRVFRGCKPYLSLFVKKDGKRSEVARRVVTPQNINNTLSELLKMKLSNEALTAHPSDEEKLHKAAQLYRLDLERTAI